ncbi:MAG: putative quinol monooxygenase [Pseudomonadales bacterium]
MSRRQQRPAEPTVTDQENLMIVVNARIEATEQTIAAMKQAISDMETASRAEAGCEDYTFSVELNQPTCLRITERWADMDALRAHFATPHMAAFRAAMAGHPPKSVTATFYEATEVSPPGA